MSAFQNSALQQSAHGFIGFGSGRDDVRRPVWVTRIATLGGFAGAVLIQAAVFSLIAQLVLDLDSALLPSLSVSMVALALGTLAVAGGKSLAGPEPRRAQFCHNAPIEYKLAYDRCRTGMLSTRSRKETIVKTLVPRQAAMRATNVRRNLRLSALAVALAAVIGGGALQPAWADDEGQHWGHERHGGHDRDWHEHGWREHEWREPAWEARQRYVYAAPGYYVYAPPPVVYVPPPEPPSINFVFPLGRR
jgi:hypothetical protein